MRDADVERIEKGRHIDNRALVERFRRLESL